MGEALVVWFFPRLLWELSGECFLTVPWPQTAFFSVAATALVTLICTTIAHPCCTARQNHHASVVVLSTTSSASGSPAQLPMLAAGRICRAAWNTAPAPALWQCLQAALGASASSSGALSFSTDSSTVNSSTGSYSGTGSYTGTGAYSATGTQSSEEVIGSDDEYSSSIEAIGSDVYDEDLGFESYDTVDFGECVLAHLSYGMCMHCSSPYSLMLLLWHVV